jgi:aspartate aminotransferase
MIALAKKVAALGFSSSMAIAQEARRLRSSGKPVIDLSVGEPDFPTPANVCDAGERAIRAGHTRYDSAAGILALREAIRSKLKRENGLDYTLEQISVGCGAKQVIFNALLATLEPDDEVIVPVPYWTSYPEMVRLVGGRPVLVTCSAANGFKLPPTDLERAITRRTRWVILNSPHNPTGAVYSKQELCALWEVLKKFERVGVISDDIYEHMTFAPHSFETIAAVVPGMQARTLTINGVSKAYSMTGWRVGYGAGPRELIAAINAIQSQTVTHTSTISQYAAVEALEGDQSVRVENGLVMAQRAQLTADCIRHINGMSCFAPSGTLFCYAACDGLIGSRAGAVTLQSDVDVARYLLEEALVAVVPGSAYGLSPYLRISFAVERETILEAFRRIAKALERVRLLG